MLSRALGVLTAFLLGMAAAWPQPAAPAAPPARRRRLSRGGLVSAVAAVLIVIAAIPPLWRQHAAAAADRRLAAALTGGDPDRAPDAMIRFGCAGCHTVSGVPGAAGMVGPPLNHRLGARVYIGGVLPNSPDNLVRWIMDPRGVNPRTAMPVTGIGEEDARNVAAFLLSRR